MTSSATEFNMNLMPPFDVLFICTVANPQRGLVWFKPPCIRRTGKEGEIVSKAAQRGTKN
jgi:hypothetical protein